MDFSQDYFLCDSCQNKDFTRIYKFSISFHGVNFSDELIYDEVTDEIYECTKCNKSFTVDQIKEGLAETKKRRKTKF
jgi:hypothetical protein